MQNFRDLVHSLSSFSPFSYFFSLHDRRIRLLFTSVLTGSTSIGNLSIPSKTITVLYTLVLRARGHLSTQMCSGRSVGQLISWGRSNGFSSLLEKRKVLKISTGN